MNRNMARLLQVLRWTALLAVLVEVGRLEVQAGLAAGWAFGWALGISLAVDSGVLLTLLTPRMRWYDRAGAILLLEAAVLLSVLHADPKLLGVGIATALVLTLWRVEALFRESVGYGDELAAARRETAMVNRAWRSRWRALRVVVANDRLALANLTARVATYQATIDQLRGELLAAEARVTAAAVRHPLATPGNGSPRPDPESHLPTDPAGQVRWIAESLADGLPMTWRQVQGLWPALSDRDAQRRLTAARKAAERHGLTAVGGEA